MLFYNNKTFCADTFFCTVAFLLTSDKLVSPSHQWEECRLGENGTGFVLAVFTRDCLHAFLHSVVQIHSVIKALKNCSTVTIEISTLYVGSCNDQANAKIHPLKFEKC